MSIRVLPVVLFCRAMYPTIRPNLLSTQSGKLRRMTCSAKACEATFSLVRTMILRVGSTVISPAIMAAAALVLPAPKTPLSGQSVLPYFFTPKRRRSHKPVKGAALNFLST